MNIKQNIPVLMQPRMVFLIYIIREQTKLKNVFSTDTIFIKNFIYLVSICNIGSENWKRVY